jgi:hypothetical protein
MITTNELARAWAIKDTKIIHGGYSLFIAEFIRIIIKRTSYKSVKRGEEVRICQYGYRKLPERAVGAAMKNGQVRNKVAPRD